MPFVNGGQPGEDGLAVDERGAHERRDEVLVLFGGTTEIQKEIIARGLGL